MLAVAVGDRSPTTRSTGLSASLSAVGGVRMRQVRDAQQQLADLGRPAASASAASSFSRVAELPALGLALGGLVGSPVAVQRADLLRQRLDLAPQLVALDCRAPLAGVELAHPVDVGRVDAPPGEGRLHGVRLSADLADVEHARRTVAVGSAGPGHGLCALTASAPTS